MSFSPDPDPLQVPRRSTIPVRVRAAGDGERAITIAVVTSDPELASACARVLSNEGYSVLTALHSGHAMLACLQERIDVLISEMSMEEVSGPTLARRMRRHHPAIRAIYLAKPGTHGGADNVLIRPFTREDLLSAVERHLPGI